MLIVTRFHGSRLDFISGWFILQFRKQLDFDGGELVFLETGMKQDMLMRRFAAILGLSSIAILGLISLPAEESLVNQEQRAEPRLKSWQQHLAMKAASPFKDLAWRSVGPSFQGGRISAIASDPANPCGFYVAAGSGNLWKTANCGTTWWPIFDAESTFAIGALAVSESKPEILWVGSGEELLARSSYAGTGVFKSTDGGKSWENMGLEDTQHIARVVIDPHNPDIVYVAALGHEYTDNQERGLFKTTDGGRNWQKILYPNERTGVVDVVVDPENSRILYAATWERDRKAWTNIESGEGSGIYRTADGGLTWKRLTNGFPVGPHVGRIGLAVGKTDSTMIYALLDNQAPRPEKTSQKSAQGELSIPGLEKMSDREFLALDPKGLASFLDKTHVPREYTADVIRERVKNRELTPRALAQYIVNLYLGRGLHVTDVIGGEIYRSGNRGESWRKVNEAYLEGFFDTYGYSFADIRISPDDPQSIYVLGISLFSSTNGGRTFKPLGGRNVHADCHDLWVDPKKPDRLLLGTDGGLNISHDRGKTWQKINNLPIGEFYSISLDAGRPYKIYGGLQDNGTVFGPSNFTPQPGLQDPWRQLAGGDGFFVFPDPADPKTVYYELQFGRVVRRDLPKGSATDIRPQVKIGEAPLRCNWMTPYLISKHNPSVLYYAANKLFKSYDRGDNWHCISPDLTTDPGPEERGDVPFGTITTIAESALKPGLIYVGTDDGLVQYTGDDGITWRKINPGLPKKWVSRIVASQHEEGTVFVSLTGSREDDFGKYLYLSTDFGRSWLSIASNLPSEPINVIREDPEGKKVLYLGTDLGVYVSLNRGKSWISLCNNLPTTPVHDLAVHPRERELVAGTHGRSVYVLDISSIPARSRD
jgi:photosystem II stability/assembly factor-like uncharacterized protein